MKLNILFRATECNGWPKLRFCIDNDVLLEHDFTSEIDLISLDLDLLDGDHELEIERYDKKDDNLIFIDGKIKRDQTVELLDFFVDNVKLPMDFKYQGTFYYRDQVVPSGLVWGPNGKFIWHFKTPIVSWIVDWKNQQDPEVIDLFVPHEKNREHILNLLDEFQQELDGK